MSGREGLLDHLKLGATEVARCWRVTRRDGQSFGFTDHDCMLEFEDTVFKADTGLSAAALSQSTGLSVDNTEAIGALSDASITEEDIQAGRFDGAEVEAWLVQWSDVENRVLQFRGSFGEIERQAGAFQVELRGLSEPMNREDGQVYKRRSDILTGDNGAPFDFDAPGFSEERGVSWVEKDRVFVFEGLNGFEPGWFERGRLEVKSGAGAGLIGVIKNDRFVDGQRRVELWQAMRVEVAPGDLVRLEAGFDGRFETARLKFNNAANFRGFPDIPGDDWVMATPARAGKNNNGGSLR